MRLSLLVERPASSTPSAAPFKSTGHTRPLQTRFLALEDIQTLLRLEARQWSREQCADEASLRERISTHPNLCVGSFCAHTGEAVSSLFMRPVLPEEIARMQRWADGARLTGTPVSGTRSLFGISLTSVDPEGAWGMICFFWPHALKQGWREIYIGSPIPGFRQALQKDPWLSVQHYVFKRGKRGMPRDPQLRYYHRKGFKHIVAVKPQYFPHPESLDHGVLLRGIVPLAWLWPVWRVLPWRVLRSLSRFAEGAL